MGVTMFDFLSDKLGYHTKLYVILPGCVNQGKKPAGTLYLLHGGGGNSQDWIRFSSIERYAEEKNFAVVMPEGSHTIWCDSPAYLIKNQTLSQIGRAHV